MKKTILAIVILSLLLSACSCASSDSKEIESLNQKISELEKQGEGTTTVSTTAVSVQAETTGQSLSSDEANNPEIFSNIEYLPQTKTLEEMKAIDNIEDWAKLSPVDRAVYFLMTNTTSVEGVSADQINSYTKEHSFSDSMAVFALGELVNASRSVFLSDGIEAAKLMGAEYYNTITSSGDILPGYKSASDWMMSDQADQGIYNYDTTMEFVSAGTPNQLTYDSLENNPINYTNVTYAYKTISTGEIYPASTIQMIVVPIQLETGEKVIWFMRGYGIDGKESPIENMPY